MIGFGWALVGLGNIHAMGGAKADVKFDAKVVKQFK
jgi:hypothetical protein